LNPPHSPRKNNTMNKAYQLILTACLAGTAGAAVTVTDNGLTAPNLGASDTGNTAFTDRFGWDSGEGFQQTFTVPAAGIIDSIYLAYNGFDNGETITLTLSVNGSTVASGLVLDGDNFSGNSATDTLDPVYWMRFDLTAEDVAVNAGSNNFRMVATADTGASWALAPLYNRNNPYSGGAASGVSLTFPSAPIPTWPLPSHWSPNRAHWCSAVSAPWGSSVGGAADETLSPSLALRPHEKSCGAFSNLPP
jgi:hypothetical protein